MKQANIPKRTPPMSINQNIFLTKLNKNWWFDNTKIVQTYCETSLFQLTLLIFGRYLSLH